MRPSNETGIRSEIVSVENFKFGIETRTALDKSRWSVLVSSSRATFLSLIERIGFSFSFVHRSGRNHTQQIFPDCEGDTQQPIPIRVTKCMPTHIHLRMSLCFTNIQASDFYSAKFVAITSARTTGIMLTSSASTLSIHGVSWRSPPRSLALGRASHGDTKTRRKILDRNADVLVGIIASSR